MRSDPGSVPKNPTEPRDNFDWLFNQQKKPFSGKICQSKRKVILLIADRIAGGRALHRRLRENRLANRQEYEIKKQGRDLARAGEQMADGDPSLQNLSVIQEELS
ncbi:hypothetical protein GR183_13595 [Stappia sp. GBMRC 2046]|uniref:Uncharacterized protein n=1 Tax=Stappia sediminis TaxID=2692190 RepID=A0A7X3S8L5_9HYPH|nr:hypothetical protein [Stappia sediminis]MXN65942.1 hypothetical protein [Stappia sediminis]